ncbi:transcription factor bHLH96-like [Populus alba x Populus x berolinensis]|uniref:Transcription factor bHLH96-like n=1 Tax=Populus alba x Populus x berolinensis TaxID=444605 RepID=A0AAD6QII1_9ROSI|nr:transcription factor bHLH96-like [Populus alba x Populus x berolinensis]
MALETVVFQQDPYSTLGLGATWIHGFDLEEEKANYHETLDTTISIESDFHSNSNRNINNSSSQEMNCACNGGLFTGGNATGGRRKRRRRRSIKDEAEVAHQRMTHINVERNRRKQMNEYLAVIRSMLPPSYVQRADQASIVGGAINFVKELEKLLQSLEAHKQIKKVVSATGSDFSSPFSEFFTFPQYSTASSRNKHSSNSNSNNSSSSTESILADQKRSIAIADVEVTMIESHANLKIQSRKHPKQLLKMVTGLHSLGLHILHLNVTTVDQMALYSFSVKVEDECKLTSVDEIAAAVHEMVGRIQEDATSNCIPSVE